MYLASMHEALGSTAILGKPNVIVFAILVVGR